jgi:hypothetical protein
MSGPAYRRALNRLRSRRPWLFAAVPIALWVLVWPLVIVWCIRSVVSSVRRTTPEERLLVWYPRHWRDRYGNEFVELLCDSRRDGRPVRFDVVRAGSAERLRADRLPARACLALCWVLLIPQGIVALTLTYTEMPTRSWFVALYASESYRPVVAIGMVLLGLATLRVGQRASRSGVAG